MSSLSLKETFETSNITEDCELEEGMLDEQIGSIAKQIVDNQLKKYLDKGQLKLTVPALNIIKKLNKMGVKKMFGFELEKVIPAFEKQMATGDDAIDKNELAALIGGKGETYRYPIRTPGGVIWRTKRKNESTGFSLKTLFFEQEDTNQDRNGVKIEAKLGYSDETCKDSSRYSSYEPQNEQNENLGPKTPKQDDVNDRPETPIQDDADDSAAVSSEELESALDHDNIHYGEHDEYLEG